MSDHSFPVGTPVAVKAKFTATVGSAPSTCEMRVLSPANARTVVDAPLVGGVFVQTLLLALPGVYWVQMVGGGTGNAASQSYSIEAVPGV